MMKSPEVTIVIPVYNGARYLGETIHSFLSQSFKNFELLAIDDGSTDASSDIVRSFKDDRVRLIRQKNSGLVYTLNRGIEEARAPYIARSDQDDISFPDRLERQINAINSHPDVVGVLSYYIKFGSRHRWFNSDKFTVVKSQVTKYEPLKDGCLLASTLLAKTGALRSIHGYRQDYYPADDFDLECRLAEAGKVLVMREPLVAYRFHAASNTYQVFADMRQKMSWTRDSYHRRSQNLEELTFDQFLAAQPQRMVRNRIDTAKLQMRIAGQHYLDGRYFRSAGHLLAALTLDPKEIVERVMQAAGLSS
jgi:glycosyltransferase involved in cell wall biosynthesis